MKRRVMSTFKTALLEGFALVNNTIFFKENATLETYSHITLQSEYHVSESPKDNMQRVVSAFLHL